jgi:hypothetical protein
VSIDDPSTELTASERLTRSRERMSHWLTDDDRDDAARTPHNGRTDAGRNVDHSPTSIGGIVTEVISEWWAEHPLHASAAFALSASRTAIVPLVRRHPAATLGGAAALGAVIIWARPWRWLLRPALVAGVASQLAARTITRMATASRPVI